MTDWSPPLATVPKTPSWPPTPYGAHAPTITQRWRRSGQTIFSLAGLSVTHPWSFVQQDNPVDYSPNHDGPPADGALFAFPSSPSFQSWLRRVAPPVDGISKDTRKREGEALWDSSGVSVRASACVAVAVAARRRRLTTNCVCTRTKYRRQTAIHVAVRARSFLHPPFRGPSDPPTHRRRLSQQQQQHQQQHSAQRALTWPPAATARRRADDEDVDVDVHDRHLSETVLHRTRHREMVDRKKEDPNPECMHQFACCEQV